MEYPYIEGARIFHNYRCEEYIQHHTIGCTEHCVGCGSCDHYPCHSAVKCYTTKSHKIKYCCDECISENCNNEILSNVDESLNELCECEKKAKYCTRYQVTNKLCTTCGESQNSNGTLDIVLARSGNLFTCDECEITYKIVDVNCDFVECEKLNKL